MNMSLKGFSKIFRAGLKQTLREKTGLFWAFILPVVMVVVLGSIYSGEGKDFNTFIFILPGILAMSLMQAGLFGPLQFLAQREQKIIRGLSVTPLSVVTILFSEITLRAIIALIQSILIFLVAYILFGVPINGNLLSLVAVIIFGSITFGSLGYMLITFIRTTESAQNLIPVIQLPMLFLSGIFFRIDSVPVFLKPVVKVIPLTYLADLLRKVTTGFAANYSVITNVTVLTVWLILTLIITVKNWKWS